MNPLSILGTPITGLVNAVGGILDKLTTTDDERNAAKAQLVKLQSDFEVAMQQASVEFGKAQRDIIVAEIGSESWAAKNWRPCLMFVFMFIIAWNFIVAPLVAAFLGAGVVVAVPIPDHMWELLKIGMGGYIVARSTEYVADNWSEVAGHKAEQAKHEATTAVATRQLNPLTNS